MLLSSVPGSLWDSGRNDPSPLIAQLQYDREGYWYANPSSIPNLLNAIGERSVTRVQPRVAERPVEVRLTDLDVGDYPPHLPHRPRQHPVLRRGVIPAA